MRLPFCLGVQSVDLSEDHFHRRLLLADCFGAGGAEWAETHPLRVELQAYLRQVCASGLVHARRRKAHPDRLGARAQFRSNPNAFKSLKRIIALGGVLILVSSYFILHPPPYSRDLAR